MVLTSHDAPREAPGQPGLRAFIYNRNSRIIPGRGHGTSTQDTNIENTRLCEQRGWIVVGTFFDRGKSASRHAKKARDDWEAMLQRARSGECDIIVYWEASRATRDPYTYLALRDLCEETGIQLCYSGRVYDMRNRSDRFMTHFDLLRAEDEAEQIRERILRTTRLNAERGGPHGPLPYGYRREYDPQTGELLRQVVDEEKADVVRDLASRVADGESIYSILRDLQERGVPSPRGQAWTYTTVRNVVTRPTNIGKRQHRGQVVGDAAWEPILDEETYYACVKMVADPARLKNRHNNTLRHLLAGVPVCGPCLYALSPQDMPLRSSPNRRGGFMYVCRSCYRASVAAPLLEAYVTAAVLARVESPHFAEALRPDVSHEAVHRALRHVQALEAQLEQARTLAATILPTGRMALPVASLAALEAQLLPQIEAARSRAVDATVAPVVRRVAGPGARERWGEMGLADQRDLIMAVARVTVHRSGRGTVGIPPGRVSISWRL